MSIPIIYFNSTQFNFDRLFLIKIADILIIFSLCVIDYPSEGDELHLDISLLDQYV